MNAEIRALFPAVNKYTYLNSAAVAPLPTVSVAAVNSQLRDVSENGMLGYPAWIETKQRTRASVAEMLNVSSHEIAFIRNTSDGISAIANGIDWAEGDNIVSFAREFPANFYAWRRIRDLYGVELRLCPERDGRIDLDEFIGLIDSNTKVVSISAVQFHSGYRADLERVGRAAREVNAIFCVDIIQAFGAQPLDLNAMHVDVAAGASHKWLCSPEGCGILFVSDRVRDRITPTLVGWISVENPWDFEDRDQLWKPNALAWESGTGCSSLFYGMEQSLLLLKNTGIDKIANHLETLTDALCEGLSEKGYKIVSSRTAGEKSQIVSVLPKGGLSSSELSKYLEEAGIIVSPRGENLRIAPHFFNNSADIGRLIEVLP